MFLPPMLWEWVLTFVVSVISSITELHAAWMTISKRAGGEEEVERIASLWKPADCPMKQQPTTQHEMEVNEMRMYVENSTECRRKILLQHFDPMNAKSGASKAKCCDVCAAAVVSHIMYYRAIFLLTWAVQ